jgi:hypothetical protein
MKAYGFVPVRIPRADLQPLRVLAREGSLLRDIGNVKTLFEQASIPLPNITVGTPTANIAGLRTGTIKLGLGINILGSIIAAMGGSTIGLGIKYERATAVQFEFVDVLQDSLDELALDQFLSAADVSSAAKNAVELLEADELYITTSTIKSSKIGVTAIASTGTAIGISADAVSGVVGGKVKVSAAGQSSERLTYEAQIPLIFAIRAVQLIYDQGQYLAMTPAKAKGVKRWGEDPAERQYLESEAPFARLQ